MSFNSLNFIWNGVSNTDMGIVLVRTMTGTIEQTFCSPKTITSEHVRFNGSYYYGSDVLNYKLHFEVMKINCDEEPLTLDERKEITHYFMPDDNFHAFISEDFPELEFIVQFTKAQFISYRKNVGVYELECESCSPYPFSELMIASFISNEDDNIMQLANNCNAQPHFIPNSMTFTLRGDTTFFSMRNLNTGKLLEFKDLDKLEKITINNHNQILSNTGKIRFDNFNWGFEALELQYGISDLEFSIGCEVEFQMQFPIMI